MEYTAEQQAEHRQELVAALRSGEYLQGKHLLKYEKPGVAITYCVVGVLLDKCELGEWVPQFGFSTGGNLYSINDETAYPWYVPAVCDYYGFSSKFMSGLISNNDNGDDFGMLAAQIEEIVVAA